MTDTVMAITSDLPPPEEVVTSAFIAISSGSLLLWALVLCGLPKTPMYLART
jgi:hypothetical protein